MTGSKEVLLLGSAQHPQKIDDWPIKMALSPKKKLEVHPWTNNVNCTSISQNLWSQIQDNTYFWCEFSLKGSWKLGPTKGIKGKRVLKSDGITKFLWTIDVQSQTSLHCWIARSHLHHRFVKMEEPNPSLPFFTFTFIHTIFA